MKLRVMLAMACGAVASSSLLAEDLLATGKKVFQEQAQPSCTICHTLEDAGAAGEIGPNLDQLQPTADQVVSAVRGGVGVMPAFGDSLSEQQIQALAHYIETVTRQ
ncbi:c-type cytochrome [Marinobacter caseinilyticus]|uniref:SorU family sulfite dehydrogenase c-type cytochrome subunit n=1 Tax=Marinobacter caseinilyticus TaxID=2692195 RepID=UPI001408A5B3|nr:cytochrome c [Marinobacter caseinilyticus]